MANVIKLHKGLNINLKGKAAQEIFTVNAPDTYALVPDDFHGVTPKVVVKEQPSKRLPDWASLELSPSVESCGCGLGPSPVRLG